MVHVDSRRCRQRPCPRHHQAAGHGEKRDRQAHSPSSTVDLRRIAKQRPTGEQDRGGDRHRPLQRRGPALRTLATSFGFGERFLGLLEDLLGALLGSRAGGGAELAHELLVSLGEFDRLVNRQEESVVVAAPSRALGKPDAPKLDPVSRRRARAHETPSPRSRSASLERSGSPVSCSSQAHCPLGLISKKV